MLCLPSPGEVNFLAMNVFLALFGVSLVFFLVVPFARLAAAASRPPEAEPDPQVAWR